MAQCGFYFHKHNPLSSSQATFKNQVLVWEVKYTTHPQKKTKKVSDKKKRGKKIPCKQIFHSTTSQNCCCLPLALPSRGKKPVVKSKRIMKLSLCALQ